MGTTRMEAVERAAAAAALGLRPPTPGAEAELQRFARDPDPRVRATALGALVRLGAPAADAAWTGALADPDPGVRRRACELGSRLIPAALLSGRSERARLLAGRLEDGDPSVAEAAAFSLGEIGDVAVAAGTLPVLTRTAELHRDPLVREAAVAALGSLGHPDGRAAVLRACGDTAAVRRRAILALAAFEGPEVEAALERALADRDWQVRQAAEDLLEDRPGGGSVS